MHRNRETNKTIVKYSIIIPLTIFSLTGIANMVAISSVVSNDAGLTFLLMFIVFVFTLINLSKMLGGNLGYSIASLTLGSIVMFISYTLFLGSMMFPAILSTTTIIFQWATIFGMFLISLGTYQLLWLLTGRILTNIISDTKKFLNK